MDVGEYYVAAGEIVSRLDSSSQLELKMKLSKALDYENNDELEGNHPSEWVPLVQAALKDIIISNTLLSKDSLSLFTEGEVMGRRANRNFPYKLAIFFFGIGFILGSISFR